MDHLEFKQHLSTLSVGKVLPDAIYVHKRALAEQSDALSTLCITVAKALKILPESWDLVKLFKKEFKVSLLSYPDFDDDSYPALKRSYQVDLAELKVKATSFEASDNPPILHRKELMVMPDDSKFELFQSLTKEGELAGLYENPFKIGFKSTWARLIAESGYQLIDGHIVRGDGSTIEQSDNQDIDRHRTAIVRHELSTPFKVLAKASYLDGEYSIFDYGCGRGDDLRELEAHGITATGWDLNFRPTAPLVESDIVNLGFVINVIEDRDERIEALQRAHSLAKKLTVVSAMLAGESVISRFKPYKDGVLTSRNTFQKYYSQNELKTFIEHTLGTECVAAAPGVFFVFKDKLEEQQFFLRRTRRHHTWNHLSHQQVADRSKELIFVKHRELLEGFWQCCLELGRLPAEDEFAEYDQLKANIGSTKKALRILDANANIEDLEIAANRRKDDLLVYFALGLFDRRAKYSEMPNSLQRDIKVFFRTYQSALAEGRESLFSIASPEVIAAACQSASEILPSSVHEESDQLTFHQKYLELLPPVLRIYVGCAAQLFGELEEVDLIKIHIRSGKVSFMGYDDFETSPLPTLTQRIKVKLRDQDVDYFDYVGPFVPPLLYWKSRVIDPSFSDFKKQISFEKKLLNLDIVANDMNFGLSQKELDATLKGKGFEVRGYRFYKTTT